MHVNEVLHRTWNMFVSPNSTLLAWSRLFGRGTLGDKYPESSSRGPSVSARPRFRHARMIRKRHGTRRAMHYSILTKSPRHSRPATAARRPPRDDVPPPSPTHPPPHPLQTPPDRDDDDADGRGRPLELDSRGWGPRADFRVGRDGAARRRAETFPRRQASQPAGRVAGRHVHAHLYTLRTR
jgi:hypothetical protein